jgi:hypothetical protein
MTSFVEEARLRSRASIGFVSHLLRLRKES